MSLAYAYSTALQGQAVTDITLESLVTSCVTLLGLGRSLQTVLVCLCHVEWILGWDLCITENKQVQNLVLL